MAFYIGPSQIEGKGVLATRTLQKGERIGEAIVYEPWFGWLPIPMITEHLGVWVNHSYQPNAELRWINYAWQIVTIKQVKRDDEITVDYSHTPWYIEGALAHYV